MIYSKVTLTSKGREILAKSQANGEKIVIDSLALGKGEKSLLEGSERLSEQMQTFQFDSIVQKENRIALKVSVNNKNLNEGYEIRELGIFAKYEEEKVLYAFINTEGGDYDRLNAYATEKDFKEIIFYIEIVVSDTEQFTIALTEEGLRQNVGVLQEKVKEQSEIIEGVRSEVSKATKRIEENKVFEAVGTELDLETGEGGIRINRIYGKTVKSPNLFKFGVTAKDVTEREGRDSKQKLIVTEESGVLKFTYASHLQNNANCAYLEIMGVDGTKVYHIKYDILENNSGHEPNVHRNTSLSNKNSLILNFYGNNGGNFVEGGKFFKLANISVTEEEVEEYQPWGMGSAGEFSEIDVNWKERKTYNEQGHVVNYNGGAICSDKLVCYEGDIISSNILVGLGQNNFEYNIKFLFWKNNEYISYLDKKIKGNSLEIVVPDGVTHFAINIYSERLYPDTIYEKNNVIVKKTNGGLCINEISQNLIKSKTYSGKSNYHPLFKNINVIELKRGTYTISFDLIAKRDTRAYYQIKKIIPYEQIVVKQGKQRYSKRIIVNQKMIIPVSDFGVFKLHNDDNVMIRCENVRLVKEDFDKHIEYKENVIYIPLLEPLRGINEEYRDYIDLKRKKIVRKVKKVVLDGSENYQFYNNKQWAVSGLTNDVLPNVNNSTLGVGISDRFLADILHNTYAGINDFRFAVSNTSMQDGLRGYISTVTSAEQAKTFFRDNPTIFLLAYKEPVEEDLTTEQIKVLTSLKSFANQTIITTTDGLAEFDLNYGKTESVALGLLADNARVYAESLEKEIEKKSEILENKIEEKNTEILSRLGKKFIFSQTAPTETEAIWVKTSDRNDVITAETFAHVSGRWKKLTESKISHVEAVIDDLKICPSTDQQGSGTDYWTNESFRNQYGNNRRRAFDDFCEHIIDGNSMIMRVKKVHSNASYGMQMQMWGKLYICMTDKRRIPFGKLAKESNVNTNITFEVQSSGVYQHGFMAGFGDSKGGIFSTGSMFSDRPNIQFYDFNAQKVELPVFLLRTGRFSGEWGKFTFKNAIIDNIPYPVVFVNEAK